MFLLILELEVTAALSMGMLVSAAAATPELALGIGIPVTIISFVFGGFYSEFAALLLPFAVLPVCSTFRDKYHQHWYHKEGSVDCYHYIRRIGCSILLTPMLC